ncbi:hypothetical protein H6F38_14700 [Paenibacillus sp. EKM208P]|nr:hypothetical protein H6F38_14700 [Paenibacillus sp. EKM208P]
MFKKEEVELYLNLHDDVTNKIYDIIHLHSAIDNKYYEVNEIQYKNNVIIVDVEYYKYGDLEYDCIHIDPRMLYEEEYFNELKNETEQVENERLNQIKTKEQQRIKEELEKARQLIAKYEHQ